MSELANMVGKKGLFQSYLITLKQPLYNLKKLAFIDDSGSFWFPYTGVNPA